ncbi:MAG: DUF3592 domain-containing protein [Lachnospiraceae bacterium]|nr:DUF3592 domain-containing protein [Lachnospiraceae bacterium]
MSKRSERKKRAEERKKEARKKLIQGAVITMVFATAMLVLGIIGFVSNRNRYEDYSSSSDVRMVDAQVTDVETKSRKDEYGKTYYFYKAKVTYTIDGTEYKGVNEFDDAVKKGDAVRVKVYKSKDGTYKIPEVTNETANKLYNILYLCVAGFGAVLLVIGIIVLIPKQEKKEQKGQKK